ncbi:hypothetical protein G5I_11752 [Acromyrmex echinatior]|uniref:Uncharacterized protein n=1 Tax=Acromyrmex echinatior TaxID=103372 RepID=F4X0H3_ACREC|nr:hypothetical protein G5I_11752 [Acromyrmex echinatior]
MSGRVEPLIVEREGMWFRVDQAIPIERLHRYLTPSVSEIVIAESRFQNSKVRFPGLFPGPKETAPDFVRVAKITTPRVVAFKPSCRVSTGGSIDNWKGRLPAGWSEERSGMVTKVMRNLGDGEIYEQG